MTSPEHIGSGETLKLAPCPFCGSSAIDVGIYPESDDSPRGYFCKCVVCLADTALSSDKSIAIAAWNRRPSPEPAVEVEREALDAAMERLEKTARGLKAGSSRVSEPGQIADDLRTILAVLSSRVGGGSNCHEILDSSSGASLPAHPADAAAKDTRCDLEGVLELLRDAIRRVEPLKGYGEDAVWRPANRVSEAMEEAAALLTSQGETIRGLEAESAELTKALTGLTANGSEFFVRRGERYTADIEACVTYVRRSRDHLHEALRREILSRKTAEAALARVREALMFYRDNWDWFPGDGENPTATDPGSPPTFYEAEPNAALKADEGKIATAALSGSATE